MGHVFWITGLPGSGKTSISRLFYRRHKAAISNLILLDGDQLRSVLGLVGHYSYEERKQVGFTYCRLCKMLSEQGINVVIATISLFTDCHNWNRAMLPNYHEIYIKVPREILLKRDQKKLFSNNEEDVVGLNLPYDEPMQPDFVLENNGMFSIEEMEEELNARMGGHLMVQR